MKVKKKLFHYIEKILDVNVNNYDLHKKKKKKKTTEKSPSSFKPPGRASRFLSIADPSLQLPGANLLRLRQLHSQAINNKDSFNFEDISDELLDTIPFKYNQIIK